ncbi:MAG: tetratricopeptide repeat protein [Candidatus Thorarchaeota archaeon]
MLNDQLKYSNTINDRLIEYFNLCSDGEVIQSLTQYANEYFQDKKYLKAVGCYLKLLSYNPQNARIWNKLAVCFIQLGEYKTAEEMSRIAFKLINEEMID